jgi:hypothetical protein
VKGYDKLFLNEATAAVEFWRRWWIRGRRRNDDRQWLTIRKVAAALVPGMSGSPIVMDGRRALGGLFAFLSAVSGHKRRGILIGNIPRRSGATALIAPPGVKKAVAVFADMGAGIPRLRLRPPDAGFVTFAGSQAEKSLWMIQW